MTNMTNEEVIDIIKKYDVNGCGYCHQGGNEVEEAFNMAIKALEQESKRINFWDLDDNDDCISRKAVLSLLADHFDNVFDMVKELPSVAILPDHDGCKDCKDETYPEYYYPCCECKQNYIDMWKRKNPTDTITMTREEFGEKLMEHYRQGREDGVNDFIKKSLIDE